MRGGFCRAVGMGRVRRSSAIAALLLLAGIAAAVVCLVGSASVLAAQFLQPVPGSPFKTATGPVSVTFSPNGRLLAAADSGVGGISVFSVARHGALSPVPGSPFLAGGTRSSVAFSPDGRFLASDSGASSVSVFAVGPHGSLSAVAGSPFLTGSNPSAVAFSPGGRYLGVATAGHGYNDGTIVMFSVSAGGQLSPVSGSPAGAGTAPTALAFSPSGARLAVVDGPGTLLLFSVSPQGELTAIPPPEGVGVNPGAVAFSPSGELLATSSSGGVEVLSGASSGTLAPVPGSPFSGGAGTGVAFSPGGNLLASTEIENDTLATFWVAPNGPLTLAQTPFSPGPGPTSVAFSPDSALVAVSFGPNEIAIFRVARQQVAIATRQAQTKHHAVKITIACLYGPPARTCRGTLSLTTKVRGKQVNLGDAAYTLRSGHKRRVNVHLSRRAITLIQASTHHRLRVRGSTTLNRKSSTHRRLLLLTRS